MTAYSSWELTWGKFPVHASRRCSTFTRSRINPHILWDWFIPCCHESWHNVVCYPMQNSIWFDTTAGFWSRPYQFEANYGYETIYSTILFAMASSIPVVGGCFAENIHQELLQALYGPNIPRIPVKLPVLTVDSTTDAFLLVGSLLRNSVSQDPLPRSLHI